MNRPAETIVAESPARFTVDEYIAMYPALDQLPDRFELVDGVILRMPPPNYPHFSIQRQLFRKLDAIFGDGIDGFIVGQDLTVRLGEATLRTPDVSIFRDPGAITGVADRDLLLLAAEVSDTSLREDLGPKRLNYAAAGVPEYWVLDVNARRIHRFTTPRDGDYQTDEEIAFCTPMAVPGADAVVAID